MANTSLITARLDPDLLCALKARAARDGRSLSAEIAEILRSQVMALPLPATGRKRKRTMGMLARRGLEDLDFRAFQRHRAAFSASLSGSASRSGHVARRTAR